MKAQRAFMRLVYDYKSYRDFLKDFYQIQKERHPSFSYAVFAKQCGLSSPAHIQLIISGKRNLTVHNIHRIGEALALPFGEFEFFETLVHLNQADSSVEKKFYEKRIEQLRLDKPKSSARLKVSTLLASAYFPAVLLSVEGKSMEAAVAAAGDRFGYSREEIQKLLEQLVREGVVVLKDEKICLSQRHLILHDKKAQSQAQKKALRQQLGLSAKAFEEMYEKDGKFYSHTFTISKKSHQLYLSEIQGLIERMTKKSDEEPGDTVMQFNAQLFPYERNLS